MNGSTTTWVAAGALTLSVALLVALVVVVVRSRARTRSVYEEARVAQEELVRRIEQLERPITAGNAPETVAEFVITDVGAAVSPRSREDAGATRIEGRLFVDIVARETVVKAASWTHAVRRALSAENRNRLRFEMRRETKRATRRRKADIKEALRQYYANQESPSVSREAAQEDVA